MNAVDPAIVVIGGGIAGAGEALFHPLRSEMDRFEWRPTGAPVPIVPAQLGELAGAFGAAKFAIDFGASTQKTGTISADAPSGSPLPVLGERAGVRAER